MNKVIGAFLWHATNNTISFMIIDGCYKTLYQPRLFNLDLLNVKQFKYKTDKIIKLFYKTLLQVYQQHPKCNVTIEFKILHQVSKDLADFYQPSIRSTYVRQKFMEQYALAKATIVPMKLSQQLRARLKRPHLDLFKKGLKALRIVKPSRSNTYQYHLWVLATHATKSNYQKILKRFAKYSLQHAA